MKTTTLTAIIAIVILAIGCTKENGINNTINSKPVQSFAAITLGNQSSSTLNCFLSFDSMKVYTLTAAAGNQSAIDLIFLHNNPDDLAMFVTPASFGAATTIKPSIYNDATYGVNVWSTKTSIQIGITDITTSDFNNISTNGQLNTAYENDPHVTIGWEINITPNKVYKYTSNRTGKRGLIKVNSVNGNYSSAGQINFDIKQIN